MDLNTIWFVLVAVLIAGYAMLDGFDLGVGALSLLARSREERDLHVAAIGPFWDGNEVWLISGGGALFAAFPIVYATVFSGFYIAFMLLLVALIARGVAIEFRALSPTPGWNALWDKIFGLGSLIATLLFGIAVGNVLRGLPIGPAPDFAWRGSFLGLLNPYSLLIGVTSSAFFIFHGANYLRMKTEGALSDRLGRTALVAFAIFLALYVASTLATIATSPLLFRRASNPVFWLISALLAATLMTTPGFIRAGQKALAFTASSITIVLALTAAAFSAFPVLVPSSLDSAHSLTIYNSASSPRTLTAMLIITLIGMPLLLGYTLFIYWIFKGPVRSTGDYTAPSDAADRAPVH